MTMIPATLLIGHPNAENNLITLYDGIQFIPRLIQSIPLQDEIKLSSYNRNSLDTNLNDKNLLEEIKKIEITSDKMLALNNFLLILGLLAYNLELKMM